ncbi:Transcriptional repressor NrdR [bacterium HR12]|nr:Transcriptional repressor NrdR [bacterium HR12]GIV00253.1 MAG: transcriptional repressor NrdR [Actinomycetota bacterium]
MIDSRSAEQGTAIRRRRECRACRRRFTTFERVEGVGLTVRKRDGSREPWDRAKVLGGIRKAIVNRPVSDTQVEQIVDRIEGRMRRRGPEVTSQQIGLEVLQHLQRLDQVAYMRFASVYKDFQQLTDFERELGILLAKKEPAKTRGR